MGGPDPKIGSTPSPVQSAPVEIAEIPQPVVPAKIEQQPDPKTTEKNAKAAKSHGNEQKQTGAVRSDIVQKNLANQLDQSKVKNPMPDIQATIYPGLPNGEGGYSNGGGASGMLQGYAKNIDRTAAGVRQKQAEAQKATQEFNKTQQAAYDNVRAAAAKDLPKALEKLEQKTNGEANRVLKDYNKAGRDIQVAERNVAGSLKEMEAAGSKHTAAVETMNKAALQEQKKNAEADLSALQKKVTERGEVFDIAMKVVGKDAKGLATDLAKNVITGMSREELQKSAQLSAKIDALDAQIGKTEDAIVKAQLKGAKQDLEAAQEKFIASKLQLNSAKLEQREHLHDLASMEKKHGTGTFFQSVEKYATNVTDKAINLRQKNDEYLNALNQPTMTDTAKIADAVREDIRRVQTYRGHDEKWSDAANSSLKYLNTMERWRQQELTTHKQIQSDALDNANILAPQTWAMDEANKAYGNPRNVLQ